MLQVGFMILLLLVGLLGAGAAVETVETSDEVADVEEVDEAEAVEEEDEDIPVDVPDVFIEYDEGGFEIGETVIVKGLDEDGRMAFTVTEAYTTGPIAGTEGMDASIVVHFTIENVSDYEYVPRELFPIYFTIAAYDPDYGLVTEMDYGAVVQPGEVYEGVLSRDFSTADDIQGGVVGFNLFPDGGLPEEGEMAPAVIEEGDLRLQLVLDELEHRE